MAEPAAALADDVAVAPGISGASVALLVVDDECQVAEASLAACRLLGLSRDELLDHGLPGFLAPAAAERLEAAWPEFRGTGGYAGPFAMAWGEQRPIDISVTSSVLPGRHLLLLSPSTEPATKENGARTRIRSRGPTTRERQILSMLATGDTDVEIAGKLNLSPATVQTHVRNAKAKLGARTSAQAVAMALRAGLITDG